MYKSALKVAAAVSCFTALTAMPSHAQITPATPAPASVEKLIPAGTGIVVGSNVQSLWSLALAARNDLLLSSLLATESVGIAGAGTSIQFDVLPWAGQVLTVVPLTSFSSKPGTLQTYAFCIQVTDAAAFDKFLGELRQNGTFKDEAKWQVSTVDGIPVHTIPGRNGNPAIQYCQIPGWFLLGFGKGEVKSILDCATGVTPSVSTVPAWKKAIALVPPTSVFWNAVDFAPIANAGVEAESTALVGTNVGRKKFGRGKTKMQAPPAAFLNVVDDIDVTAVDLQTKSVHAISGTFPKTDAAADLMRNLSCSAAQPFVQYPDATIAFAFNKPKSALKFIQTWAAAAGSVDPSAARQWTMILQHVATMDRYLATIDAPVEAALTSHAGHGLGLVVAINAQDHASALKTASLIADGFAASDMPVTRIGDTWKIKWGTSKADRKAWADAQAYCAKRKQDLVPELEVDGNLVQLTTAPYWIHSGSAGTGALVPALADGQLAAFAGNFQFLEPIKVWVDLGMPSAARKSGPGPVGKWIDSIGLRDATMHGHTTVDPVTGDLVMESTTDNWDYGAGIVKAIVIPIYSIIGPIASEAWDMVQKHTPSLQVPAKKGHAEH